MQRVCNIAMGVLGLVAAGLVSLVDLALWRYRGAIG